MRVKYSNYVADMIDQYGTITRIGTDTIDEARTLFRFSKTAMKMILYEGTHNNCRLKHHSEYGIKEKQFV